MTNIIEGSIHSLVIRCVILMRVLKLSLMVQCAICMRVLKLGLMVRTLGFLLTSGVLYSGSVGVCLAWDDLPAVVEQALSVQQGTIEYAVHTFVTRTMGDRKKKSQ